jgi:hypothetical protein
MSSNNPVNAYTYVENDRSNPITNSNFVYGTLGGGNWNASFTAKGTDFGSLTVSNLYGNTNLVTTVDGTNTNGTPANNSLNSTIKVLQILENGIYRLKTTLSFSGSGFGNGNNQDFEFFVDDKIRTDTAMGTILSMNPYDISLDGSTTHKILSLGYIYSNNGANYSINSLTQPYAVLTNKANGTSTLTNNGISVVETILYLHNTKLYFNISANQTGNGINATGNFMLELLRANSNYVIGSKYMYNSINKLDTTFTMLLLENGKNVTNSTNTPYTAFNNVYNTLAIKGSPVYGNSNLINFGSQSVSVINSGIYRIRITLNFSGSGFSQSGSSLPPVWNIQNLQLGLFYTTSYNTKPNANTYALSFDTSLTSSNKILSIGYLYSNNGPDYDIVNGVLNVNLPCRATSSTTLVNNGISVVELIVFLIKDNYIGFNIRPGSGDNGNYITAQGNVIFELLAHTDSLSL